MKYFFFITLILLNNTLHAAQTCSRTAIINYQEVLVDSNNSEKGEGLRFHLEKDPIAKEYLDKYQAGTGVKWQTAVLGTAGTGLLIAGVVNSDSDTQKVLLISGAATLFVNFLLARTLEFNNEKNLIRAIDEYNQRNLPKIFFNQDTSSSNPDKTYFQAGLIQQWQF